MSKKLIFVTTALVLLCALALGLLIAGLRNYQGKVFQRARHLQTAGGTNYVLRLMGTTVGKTSRGYLLMVTVELENPNPFETRLSRREFLLKDTKGVLYEPSANGLESVVLPARETFSFTLPDSALEGTLKFRVAHNYWAQVRGKEPYKTRLREGEFRAYPRSDW